MATKIDKARNSLQSILASRLVSASPQNPNLSRTNLSAEGQRAMTTGVNSLPYLEYLNNQDEGRINKVIQMAQDSHKNDLNAGNRVVVYNPFEHDQSQGMVGVLEVMPGGQRKMTVLRGTPKTANTLKHAATTTGVTTTTKTVRTKEEPAKKIKAVKDDFFGFDDTDYHPESKPKWTNTEVTEEKFEDYPTGVNQWDYAMKKALLYSGTSYTSSSDAPNADFTISKDTWKNMKKNQNWLNERKSLKQDNTLYTDQDDDDDFDFYE